jgi:hypothetical protein
VAYWIRFSTQNLIILQDLLHTSHARLQQMSTAVNSSPTCTPRRFPYIGKQELFNHHRLPNLYPTALSISGKHRLSSPVFFLWNGGGEKRGRAQGQNKHGRGLELQQEEYRNWKGEEKEEHVLFARCIVGICSVVHGLQILVFLCSVSLNTNHVPTLCSCSPD